MRIGRKRGIFNEIIKLQGKIKRGNEASRKTSGNEKKKLMK